MLLSQNGDVTRNRVLTAVLGKRGDIGDGWEEIYSYQSQKQVINMLIYVSFSLKRMTLSIHSTLSFCFHLTE